MSEAYSQILHGRLEALGFAIAGLENLFDRLRFTWISFPSDLLHDPQVQRNDVELCRHEFGGRSAFFRILYTSYGTTTVDAFRLRTLYGTIQTRLRLGDDGSVLDALDAAEQDVLAYHVNLAVFQPAMSNLSNIAQRHHQKNQYAALKAGFHFLGSTQDPDPFSDTLWDLTMLEEAFDESPVKRSEFEIQENRLQALFSKAEQAISQFNGYAAEDHLHESDLVISKLQEILSTLEALLAKIENKRRAAEWLRDQASSSQARVDQLHTSGEQGNRETIIAGDAASSQNFDVGSERAQEQTAVADDAVSSGNLDVTGEAAQDEAFIMADAISTEDVEATSNPGQENPVVVPDDAAQSDS